MHGVEATRLVADRERACAPGPRPSTAAADGPAARRPRRIDPDRKACILTATVEVLAEHGVAGMTHRLIAARAGVPLAMLTYHFASLADLRAQGFAWYTAAQNHRLRDVFEQVTTREQFVEALVDVAAGEPGDGSAVVGFELHLAALRDPSLRPVMRAWTEASRAMLERFTDPHSAADLDALLEGLILHRLLTTEPMSRVRLRAAVLRALPPPDDTAPASTW